MEYLQRQQTQSLLRSRHGSHAYYWRDPHGLFLHFISPFTLVAHLELPNNMDWPRHLDRSLERPVRNSSRYRKNAKSPSLGRYELFVRRLSHHQSS